VYITASPVSANENIIAAMTVKRHGALERIIELFDLREVLDCDLRRCDVVLFKGFLRVAVRLVEPRRAIQGPSHIFGL